MQPSLGTAVSLVVILLMLAAVPSAVGAGQATPVASPVAAESTTAIVVSATNDPLRVAGSDGVDHLEYDLIVTNTFVAPVTLTSIEVLARDGESLLRLEGDDLVTATQPLTGLQPTQEIPASGTVAVVMDVTVAPGRAVDRLTHRIAYELAPDAPARSLIGSFEVHGPALMVDPRPATVIAPPLRGDGWLNASGCCSPANLHRAIRIAVDGDYIGKQETFAIDWIRIQDGKVFEGDGSQREQWFGFGAEILAVGDGTVVAVQVGRPEEVPLQPVENVHQPGDYGGNTVTIELEPEVYAFYAHFQPDSITIAVGDQVTTGQLLGLLGNTGNTSGPHLHFGLLDHPDPLIGESLPMVFDEWTLAGRVSPEAWFDASGEGTLALTGTPEDQSGTLQLFLDVATFD